jgi:hypothetical protein
MQMFGFISKHFGFITRAKCLTDPIRQGNPYQYMFAQRYFCDCLMLLNTKVEASMNPVIWFSYLADARAETIMVKYHSFS